MYLHFDCSELNCFDGFYPLGKNYNSKTLHLVLSRKPNDFSTSQNFHKLSMYLINIVSLISLVVYRKNREPKRNDNGFSLRDSYCRVR